MRLSLHFVFLAFGTCEANFKWTSYGSEGPQDAYGYPSIHLVEDGSQWDPHSQPQDNLAHPESDWLADPSYIEPHDGATGWNHHVDAAHPANGHFYPYPHSRGYTPSDFSPWQDAWKEEDGHDLNAGDQHPSSLPSTSHHHPTGSSANFPPYPHSFMSYAPEYSPGTPWGVMKPANDGVADAGSSDLPPRSTAPSSAKATTTLGLPIQSFTEKFLRGAIADFKHQPAKIIKYVTSFGSNEPAIVADDVALFESCKPYHTGRVRPQTDQLLRNKIVVFVESAEIWLIYWNKQKQINLHQYMLRIDTDKFENMLPLFLFYLEALAMISPKIGIGELDTRCEWFIGAANSVDRNSVKMRKVADSLRKQTRRIDGGDDIQILWIFLTHWAKTYRPTLFHDPPSKDIPIAIRSLLNDFFLYTSVKLTDECRRIIHS